MRETGRILKNDINGIEIEMNKGFACSGCSACFIDKNKAHVLRINQEIDVKPGELVEIEVQPAFAIKSAFLLFFMPLLMLILGYFLFMDYIHLWSMEMPYRGIFGAILGVIISFILVHLYDKRLQKNVSDPKIRIVKILGT
jgi:sigma-E factor negative regulatory protein RseC